MLLGAFLSRTRFALEAYWKSVFIQGGKTLCKSVIALNLHDARDHETLLEICQYHPTLGLRLSIKEFIKYVLIRYAHIK